MAVTENDVSVPLYTLQISDDHPQTETDKYYTNSNKITTNFTAFSVATIHEDKDLDLREIMSSKDSSCCFFVQISSKITGIANSFKQSVKKRPCVCLKKYVPDFQLIPWLRSWISWSCNVKCSRLKILYTAIPIFTHYNPRGLIVNPVLSVSQPSTGIIIYEQQNRGEEPFSVIQTTTQQERCVALHPYPTYLGIRNRDVKKKKITVPPNQDLGRGFYSRSNNQRGQASLPRVHHHETQASGINQPVSMDNTHEKEHKAGLGDGGRERNGADTRNSGQYQDPRRNYSPSRQNIDSGHEMYVRTINQEVNHVDDRTRQNLRQTGAEAIHQNIQEVDSGYDTQMMKLYHLVKYNQTTVKRLSTEPTDIMHTLLSQVMNVATEGFGEAIRVSVDGIGVDIGQEEYSDITTIPTSVRITVVRHSRTFHVHKDRET